MVGNTLVDKAFENMTKKLLFVCLGNICRSPAAEEIMRQIVLNDRRLAGRYEVDSAGIGSWHVGCLPDSRMRRHGKMHGYDFHSRARQVRVEDFDRFDLILGMDDENIADLRRLARSEADCAKIKCLADFMTVHPRYDTIPDPYYGDAADFELAISLIEDACRGLADKLANSNGGVIA